MSLKVHATSRFIREADRATPLLRACAAGALSDLLHGFASLREAALRRYPPVEGMRKKVLEIDISGGDRMFAHYRDSTLYLLWFGDHDSTKHYKETANVESEIQRCGPLPAFLSRLMNAPFFVFNLEEDWEDFANEADPSWLGFLDKQQGKAVSQLIARTQDAASKDWCFAVVAGGPGTGKTSVLLSLFERVWECDLFPQVIIEDQVSDYVRAFGGIDLSPYRLTVNTAERLSEGGILLVDDPKSLTDIEKLQWLARSRAFRAVVVAVDPLQLAGKVDDDDFRRLTAGKGSLFIRLTSCYRQKSAVGKATKRALDAIASSSPYLDDGKKEQFESSRRMITELANAMEFPNPGGRFKVFTAPPESQVRAEVDRLKSARGLWRHWSPYLIAYGDDLRPIPPAWEREFRRLPRRTELLLGDALSVKGVEFQHSIIVMSEPLFLQLQDGFQGAGRKGYEARQLLRIPISRAKDSVTVMVMPRGGG